MKYWQAIWKGMAVALGADLGYTGYMIKNPLSPEWEVISHDNAVYSLERLRDSVDPIYSTESQNNFDFGLDPKANIYEDARHQTLFEVARRYAYKQVRDCHSLDQLMFCIEEFSSIINNNQFRPSLPFREVSLLAKKIATWTWARRNSIGDCDKNRGAMGFEPMEWYGNKDDFLSEVKRRQSEGASYTHKLQRLDTESKIVKAIKELIGKGEHVTMGKVSKMIGTSKSNLSMNYKHLFHMV